MPEDQSLMRDRFAVQLRSLLSRAYDGRVPSLSSVARDLSLRAPHLPHVSTEAVRKWLNGKAIPQSPRMQTLVEWLGEELLEPFEQSDVRTMNKAPYFASGYGGYGGFAVSRHQLLDLIGALSEADQKLIYKLVQALSKKSSPETDTLSKAGSGLGAGASASLGKHHLDSI